MVVLSYATPTVDTDLTSGVKLNVAVPPPCMVYKNVWNGLDVRWPRGRSAKKTSLGGTSSWLELFVKSRPAVALRLSQGITSHEPVTDDVKRSTFWCVLIAEISCGVCPAR